MSQRTILAATMAVIAVVAAVVVGSWWNSDESSPADSSVSEATTKPSLPLRTVSVPPPSGGSVDEVEPAKKTHGKVTAGPLDGPITLRNDLTVEVTDIGVQKVTGIGPGEVGGRSVVAKITVTNPTKKKVNLGSAWALLTLGPTGRVATPQTADPYDPFQGSIAPGESASGTYVFAIGSSKPTDLDLLVTLAPGQPQAKFHGDLS